jgi:hypothetical protein
MIIRIIPTGGILKDIFEKARMMGKGLKFPLDGRGFIPRAFPSLCEKRGT